MVKHKKPALKSTKAKKTGTPKKLTQPHAENQRTKCQKNVEYDRRINALDRRIGVDRRQKNIPVAMEQRVCERRAKVNRRRQIDPTTCERDYTHEEIEFMNAMEEYKRTSGRMFPTCSEVLEVLRKLGYERRHITFVPTMDDATLSPDISPPLSTF